MGMGDPGRELPPVTGNGENASVRLIDYLLAVRAGDRSVQEERDRRYAEVNVEKEKALKIKETADLAALQLAREIQTYKDEKANELRSQIERERGNYATRDDLASAVRELQAAIKPLVEYVASDAGQNTGSSAYRTERRLDMGQVIAVVSVIVAVLSVVLYVLKK